MYVLLNLYSVSYSTTPVTNENLKSAHQKYITYSNSSQTSIANNVITITKNGKSYNVNYDLTNQPTFNLEVTIPKGISYTDWENIEESLKFPLLGYLLTANIQGIEFDDISTYFGMSLLINLTNSSNKNDYVIIDDTSLEDGVTIEKDPNDTKTIYTSEFGDRVIEYVNALYPNKIVFSDSSEGINSYEWSTERTDLTDTSVKLVSTLKINTNADFTKIKDFVDDTPNISGNNSITESNADYVIKLKVGQKCKIESSKRVTGYDSTSIGRQCRL